MNKKATVLVGLTAFILLIIGVFAFTFGIIYFGFAGFFKLFDVQYDSAWSLVIFLLVYFVIDALFDFILLPILAMSHIFGRNRNGARAFRILTKIVFAWAALHTVDEMMSSIDIPTKTEIILVLLLFLLELATDERKTIRIEKRMKS